MKCLACKFSSENLSELNKHISNCENYGEWIKNYIPPINYECKNCGIKFIKTEYLEEHNKNCKK